MATKKAKPEAEPEQEPAETTNFAPAIEMIYLNKKGQTWRVASDNTARIDHLKSQGFEIVETP